MPSNRRKVDVNFSRLCSQYSPKIVASLLVRGQVLVINFHIGASSVFSLELLLKPRFELLEAVFLRPVLSAYDDS